MNVKSWNQHLIKNLWQYSKLTIQTILVFFSSQASFANVKDKCSYLSLIRGCVMHLHLIGFSGPTKKKRQTISIRCSIYFLYRKCEVSGPQPLFQGRQDFRFSKKRGFTISRSILVPLSNLFAFRKSVVNRRRWRLSYPCGKSSDIG